MKMTGGVIDRCVIEKARGNNVVCMIDQVK